jgi:hypothetical protein
LRKKLVTITATMQLTVPTFFPAEDVPVVSTLITAKQLRKPVWRTTTKKRTMMISRSLLTRLMRIARCRSKWGVDD